MKKSSLTLFTLLALPSLAVDQAASASSLVTQTAPSNGTQQFATNGVPAKMSLCTFELCQMDENGKMTIEPVAAGSASAIIAQASIPEAGRYLVFYPEGKELDPKERRILRTRYLVTLEDNANLDAIQSRCGMHSITRIREGANLAVCEESSAGRVMTQLTNVLSDPDIQSAQPIFAKRRIKRVAPTDVLYAPSVTVPESNYQWYLNNEGINGGVPDVDINIEDVFCPPTGVTVTGAGVTVSIVDDGVAIDHVDLVDNATGPHLNLFAVDPGDADNPATFDIFSTHGTSVAGIIGAAANNGEIIDGIEQPDGQGIAGVAPGASLSGIRLLPSIDDVILIDDFEESLALGFETTVIDVSNNSWGPPDDTLDLERPGELTLAALESGAVDNDVVYVWAGGNGGDIFDRSDYDGYANSIYTIAVGAVDDSGSRSNFSEEGSNLVVVAPSNGGAQAILTTSFGIDEDDDGIIFRTSEYDTEFGGTSAAAPMVSGVVALMLEANPALNWRQVQDILIRSASMVDPTDGDWVTNAAGLTFNHKYGAGLVDATAAVALATSMEGVLTGPQVTHERQQFFANIPDDTTNPTGIVPDNDTSSLVATFDMTQDVDGNTLDNLRVEHVVFRATIVTQSRTDLDIVLISPSGTQSIVHAVNADNTEASIFAWPFMSVRNWGEGSAGEWVVQVTDRVTGNPAILNNATLSISGSLDPDAPVGNAPLLTSATFLDVIQGDDVSYVIESLGAASVAVGDLPEGFSFDAETNTITGTPVDAGLFDIPLILTSDDGVQGVFTLNLVVRPTALALGDAIGFPDREAFFGGDAPWEFEFSDTNDPVGSLDARSVRSAIGLQDGQESIFGFDNLDAGVLIFDWKTSSEEGFDRLWFNFGGEVPHTWEAFISGNREWATTAVVLSEASNDVRWLYTKDVSLSSGEDRGLVDNLRLVDYDRHIEDLTEAGPITGFTPEFDSRMIFYSREFAFGSPRPGGTQPTVIASPSIGNGQTASMKATLVGPGTFSYLAVIYAGSDDFFEVLVDGALCKSQAGAIDIVGPDGLASSSVESIAIPEGSHVVELRFRKGFTQTLFATLADDLPFEGIFLDNLTYATDGSFAAFTAGVAGGSDPSPEGDSDGDGYSNFTEYAFGGDISIADIPRYLPKLITDGDNRFIEYGLNASRNDLGYTPQQSLNLTDWVDAESAILDRTEAGFEVYRIPVNAESGQEKLFYRVVAENQ